MSLSDFIGPVTIGAPQGNTAGVPASISNGSVVLAGGPNITLSQVGRTITVSGGAGGAGGGVAVSADASSQSTGTVIFSNSNGLAFGLNAGTLTGSYTVPVVPPETPFGVSAGTQSVSTGTLVFSNSNNIAFGMSGSSRVTASAALSMFAVSNTTQSTSGSVNISALSFAGAGIASVGVTGGSVVVSVPAGGGAAGTNTAGISNLGNTAGTSGVITGSNIQLVFAGGNNITLSQSINGSSATITVGGPNTAAETPFGISAGTQSVSTGTIVFSDSHNVTFGMSGSSRITASASQSVQTQAIQSIGVSTAGNTSGDTVVANFQRIMLAGVNNITLSQSSNAGSVSITVSGPTQTNQQMTLFATGNTTLSSTGTTNASSMVFRGSGVASVGITNGSILIDVPAGGGAGFSAGVSTGGNTAGATGVTGTRLVFVGSNNITLSQTTDANGATISVIGGGGGAGRTFFGLAPHTAVIGASTNFNASLMMQPLRIQGGQIEYSSAAVVFNYTQASNSTLTASLSLSMALFTQNVSTMSLLASTSSSISLDGSGTVNSLENNGRKNFIFGSVGTLTEGDYVLGVWYRTATAGANATLGVYGVTSGSSDHRGNFGVARDASNQHVPGLGHYSVTFSSAMPNSIAYSELIGTPLENARVPLFFLTSGTV